MMMQSFLPCARKKGYQDQGREEKGRVYERRTREHLFFTRRRSWKCTVSSICKYVTRKYLNLRTYITSFEKKAVNNNNNIINSNYRHTGRKARKFAPWRYFSKVNKRERERERKSVCGYVCCVYVRMREWERKHSNDSLFHSQVSSISTL